MIFVGIDPGLSGAVAHLRDDALSVWSMPIFGVSRGGKNKNEIDHIELARILDVISKTGVSQCVIEQAGAHPGQGVTSSFQCGRSFGLVLGAAAAQFWRIEIVAPGKWKRALDVPASKDGARARASSLMPTAAENWTRKKDDGRAEAALLALYARRIHAEQERAAA